MTERIEGPRGDNSSTYWNDYYDKLSKQGVQAAYAPPKPGAPEATKAVVVQPQSPTGAPEATRAVLVQGQAAPVAQVAPENFRPPVPAHMNPNRSADALNGEWRDNLHEQQRRETERLQREFLAASQSPTGEPNPGHGPPAHHGILYADAREGSLEAGFDIGIAEAGVSVGRHTGVYAGSPILATRASVNADLDPNHARVGAEWQVAGGLVTYGQVGVNASLKPTDLTLHVAGEVHALADTVNATYDTGLRVGERIGGYTRATGNVGPVRGAYASHAYLTPSGVDAAVHSRAQIGHLASVGSSGHLSLGRVNQAHVDAHGHIGPIGNRSGAGFYPDRGPDVYSITHVGHQKAGFELNPPLLQGIY